MFETIPNGLPAGWAWVTIGAVTKTPKRVDPAQVFEGTFNYIDLGSIDNTIHRIAEVNETAAEKAPSRARQSVTAGDTLFSCVRVYLGNIAQAQDEHGGSVASTAFAVLSPSAAIHPRFLFHYMTWRKTIASLTDIQRGNSPPAVLERDVRAYPFALPPLPEQERIVSRTEELFSSIEAGERAIDQARRDIARYRKSVLKAAVTGALTTDWREANAHLLDPAEKLLARILEARRVAWENAELEKLRAKGKPLPTTDKEWATFRRRYKEPRSAEEHLLVDLPREWALTRLDQLTLIKGGVTVDRKRKPADPVIVPYLRVANVQRGHLKLDEIKTILVDSAAAAECMLSPGDVLLNEGGDRDKLGRGWVWEDQLERCIYQNHVFRARPVSEDVNPYFLSHYANEFGFSFFSEKGKQTTNLASISLTAISGLPVPLPSKEEQAEIISRVEEAFSRADAVERALRDQACKARALRQSLLKAAFEGRLVAQDPSDEPAAVLLERIRDSRSVAPRSTRRKTRA